MSDVIEEYENPCDECDHRINAYCKGYTSPIEHLDISKCKRRKTGKRRKK